MKNENSSLSLYELSPLGICQLFDATNRKQKTRRFNFFQLCHFHWVSFLPMPLISLMRLDTHPTQLQARWCCASPIKESAQQLAQPTCTVLPRSTQKERSLSFVFGTLLLVGPFSGKQQNTAFAPPVRSSAQVLRLIFRWLATRVLWKNCNMTEINSEDAKQLNVVDNTPKIQVVNDSSVEDPMQLDISEENPMPSLQQEEEIVKNKYGGLLPKKPPLISKDHERAFFDSADWALGKQGEHKSKGPLEALRPKLQPTPHHQIRSRRSAYAPADVGEDSGNNHGAALEDQSHTLHDDNNINIHSEEQSCSLGGSANNNIHSEEQSCHN